MQESLACVKASCLGKIPTNWKPENVDVNLNRTRNYVSRNRNASPSRKRGYTSRTQLTVSRLMLGIHSGKPLLLELSYVRPPFYLLTLLRYHGVVVENHVISFLVKDCDTQFILLCLLSYPVISLSIFLGYSKHTAIYRVPSKCWPVGMCESVLYITK